MRQAADATLLILAILMTTVSAQVFAAKAPSVELNGRQYSVEIADDDASRARGLMGRDHMAEDHGMLFVFESSAPRAFWMKNCKFAQDMLFFNADRRLVSVQHDVPPCLADPCPAYPSGAPARYVLELNAGQARKIGVSPGDELLIRQ